jgi:hypothetical protein
MIQHLLPGDFNPGGGMCFSKIWIVTNQSSTWFLEELYC